MSSDVATIAEMGALEWIELYVEEIDGLKAFKLNRIIEHFELVA